MKEISKKVVIFIMIFMFICNIIQLSSIEYKQNDSFSEKKPFILFDFDNRKSMSNVGGQAGIFDFDADDPEAYCRIGTSKDEDLNKDGFYMKISYDVDSTKPAFNGWWTKLNNSDLSKFDAVSFQIKGDKEKGFSDIFKIELKDKSKKIEAIVEGITDEWSTIIIPFYEFEGDIEGVDWSSMKELVIVFEDWRLKQKEGRYYIDDISFIPKTKEKVTYKEIIKK